MVDEVQSRCFPQVFLLRIYFTNTFFNSFPQILNISYSKKLYRLDSCFNAFLWKKPYRKLAIRKSSRCLSSLQLTISFIYVYSINQSSYWTKSQTRNSHPPTGRFISFHFSPCFLNCLISLCLPARVKNLALFWQTLKLALSVPPVTNSFQCFYLLCVLWLLL